MLAPPPSHFYNIVKQNGQSKLEGMQRIMNIKDKKMLDVAKSRMRLESRLKLDLEAMCQKLRKKFKLETKRVNPPTGK